MSIVLADGLTHLQNQDDFSARYETLDSLFRDLETGQQQNDSTEILRTTFELAQIYDDREKYDSALIFYNRAIRIAEITGDKGRLALALNNLGNIYLSWGNYQKSLDLYLKSQNICIEIEDSTGISKALNNIGIIYYDWGDLEMSLQCYQRSFEVDSLMNNLLGQSQTLNNIAVLYDEIGKKEKALLVYLHSLDLATQLNDHYQIAVSSSNLGGFFLETHDFIKAEEYYLKTLSEYEKANSTIGIAETYILLGDLSKEKKEFKEALKYLRKGLDIVLPMNLSWSIMNAYSSMQSVYVAQGDFENAYNYFSMYHRIYDSIFSMQTSNQLALLTNAYEIQQKDQAMELQQVRMDEQKARIKRQMVIMIALGALALIILIFTLMLIKQYRLRMKAWRQLLVQHEEILRNRQELIIAKEKAEESDRLKSAFLVNISHELRTPMNGIMGFTDLLQKGTATAEQHQLYLSYIASSSRQLLKVLNDIIDISSIETKQLKLEVESCSIHQMFSELLKRIEKEMAEGNNQKLTLIYNPPIDADQHTCLADKKRLTQVVFNLLSNALRFTNEGKIEFGYEMVDEKYIKIHVKDTGIGIERSNFEVIFERFRQVDDSTTRQHSGSGLGLAICKELVNMMNGRIYLESELGKGSSFFVEIPCIPVG